MQSFPCRAQSNMNDMESDMRPSKCQTAAPAGGAVSVTPHECKSDVYHCVCVNREWVSKPQGSV